MNAPDQAALDTLLKNERCAEQRVHDSNHWHARLDLAYGNRHGKTVPSKRSHYGPLRVLKGFPSASGQPDLWEQIIVHPPGGIAGGDTLGINVHLARDSRVLLTSPGAAKWYRSRLADLNESGADNASQPSDQLLTARQTVDIKVDTAAACEWLPLENIFFDHARTQLETHFELAPGARLIAADLCCLGRPAGQQPFATGRINLHTRITRAAKTLFVERANITGNDAALQARAGLHGAICFGTLLAVPAAADQTDLAGLVTEIRKQSAAQASNTAGAATTLAVTALPELIVVRWHGNSAQQGWTALRIAWEILRPHIIGLPARAPRIWAC